MSLTYPVSVHRPHAFGYRGLPKYMAHVRIDVHNRKSCESTLLWMDITDCTSMEEVYDEVERRMVTILADDCYADVEVQSFIAQQPD